MVVVLAWRTSSVLLASCPLLLLLVAASYGGKSKAFLRNNNNYSPQDQPQRNFFAPTSFNRFRRNFRADDESSPFAGFSGFPAPSSTGSFRSGQSFRSRKGGSRSFSSSRGSSGTFPSLAGGPDSFLEAATTERSETDDEIQAFQFTGSAGFGNSRPGTGGSRKGGASRGASKGGGSKSPSSSSPGLGGRDSPAFSFGGSSGPTFGGSSGIDFGALAGQDFSGPADSLFNRGSGLDFSGTGGATFGGAAAPDFNSPPGGIFGQPSGSPSGGNFGSPGTSFSGSPNSYFGGSSGGAQAARTPPGSSSNSFPSFLSSFSGSGTNPFGSTSIQFPPAASRGQFPPSSSSIFPQPVEASLAQFPPPANFGLPEASANFPYPIDEQLAKLLLGEIETTTTKPPIRVTSAEDRNKVFSGGLDDDEDPDDLPLALPLKGGSKKVPETKDGCNSKPTDPANGRIDCSTFVGCRAVCKPRYQFPTGERRLFLVCNDGEWKVTGGEWDALPDCEPICNPPCENSGICLAPDVCQCPDNWEGDQCEVAKAPVPKTCSNKPPTPANSRIFCSRDECIARCHEGYHFDEGTTRLTFECDDGSWVISHSRWTGTSPDCQPICDPACQNEGRCIAPDVCECTPEYRGDICQYPISNCDPKNLGFNGGYNCSGEGMEFGCALWCPEGVEFEFAAADFYSCDYATGTWSPSPIPKCDYGFLVMMTPLPVEATRGAHPTMSGTRHTSLITTTRTMKKLPGSCFTWAGLHYKSFDGKVYSFESSCPYTLLQDSTHGTFTVNLRTQDGCEGSSCRKVIQIFLEDDEYVLQASESGQPSLAYRNTNLAIPGQMNGVVSERVAHFVVVKVSGLGLTIKWDMKSLVVTEISELLWNRTSGLCGRRDGREDNDWSYADGTQETNMNSFLQAWQAKTLGDRCLDRPRTKHPCGRRTVASEADRFCSRLRDDPRFNECRQVVDVEPYINACRWDYCDCDSRDRESCACESFAAFYKECTSVGVDIPGGWRSHDLCLMECGLGKVYNPCMSAIQSRCGQPSDGVRPEFCVEGCDCPEGLVLHQGLCIPSSDCPCTYRNKEYSAGDTIPNDCNSCTCLGGEWVCTEVKCGSRCAAVGDPHYTTFDGRRFDFMGKCSYYLVQGQDFSIEAENTPCAGAISESMNFPASVVSQFPSCTKSVTVRLDGTVIRLKQDREVTVNSVELKELPAWVNGAYIKAASSLFIMVELTNGLDVWWDGHTRVYIDAPAEFRGQTAGLCGTFTDNQRDDFLTPEGDIEQNVVAFANKWKTSEKCPDQPLAEESRPCDRHVQNKAVAEKFCAKLKSNLFAPCHLEVDPDPYYRDCLYDMCSCETKMDGCLCPVLAAYSKECARKGVIVDWRAEVRECGVHCTGGQKYQVCGNSCSHTCLDLATNPDCARKCVEGCNCLEGFSLDGDGICVPITECPCVHDAKEYKPGYEMMQQQEDGSYLVCECYNAGWNCWEPRDNETVSRPQQVECRPQDNELYTDCLPEEENTCQTMHLRPVASDLCRPGCICAAGFVRDADTGACIRHNQCPCHHGGRSYDEKATITEDCNTCICEGGQWLCTERQCPGICTAWGDSHYKTFDGRLYEFHGTCDYLLAKGKASRADTFEVIVQNVPCGTDGVTCAKSITLRVGTGDAQEVIEFSRNKPAPSKNMTRTIIRQAGIFVFAEVTDMGLVLQWDRGTRAYLRLDPIWQGKVRGLCGNYNGDEQDDFRTPAGGSSEVSVKIFGDSWRLQNYCPDSILIKDTCSLHPQRKVWAADQCAVLKTETFASCHSEVPVEPYEERCQFDACGCDTGGDCECLCTALAAYAHECNIHGVYIKWRTPDFCPMQCDKDCEHYEPCIPTCPQETCDTLLDPSSPVCTQDACVEGCAKDICPPGQVYKSATDLECVPKADCEKKCLEIDGEVYMEGDVISQDDCHTCSCSRKKKICRGTPCPSSTTSTTTRTTSRVTTPLPPSVESDTTTSTPAEKVEGECQEGWTEWFSEDKPIIFRQNSDTERVPEKITKSKRDKGFCARSQMVDIKCRSVGTHRPHVEQQGVTCSLEEGLLCQGRNDVTGADACWDYEVAFLCDCDRTTIEAVVTTTPATPAPPPLIVTPSVPPVMLPVPMACEEEGWSQWYNVHFPNTDGEFESLSEIRKIHSLCPDHYISEVECRPVQGGQLESIVTCDRKGASCRNNAGQQYCQDYKVRVLCQCECQDGLGMEDYNITNDQITSSSLMTPDDKPHAARLNSDWAWTSQPVDEFDEKAAQAEWLQVDLEEVKEVTGVVTQGHPYFEQFVEVFAVQVSETGAVWEDVKDTGAPFAKQFIGNNDRSTPVTNLFPEPVFARYVRIIPISFYSAISLRVELKGCDIKESTTPPPGVTPSTAPPWELVTESVCSNGWTPWMNTHTPSPGDWDDMDDLRSLAEKYTFCAPHQILDTQCQVVGVGLAPETSGQVGVTCNTNTGLQCNDDLQAPHHCYDYEIRFYCDCALSTTPATPTTTTEGTTTTPVPESCSYFSPQYKMHEEDCRKFYQCSVTSFTGMTYVVKECGPGTFFNPDTLTCDFEYNVLLVRPECSEALTPPLRLVDTTPATTPTEPCTDTWSEWFNVSHPDTDNGDFETFERIREMGYDICDDMYIMDIECQYNQEQRTKAEGRGGFKGGRKGRKGGRRGQALDRLTYVSADYRESGDMYVQCSTQSGLICQNYQQPGRGKSCQDYAIRVLCSCEAKRTTPSRQPPTTPYEDVRNATILTTPYVIDGTCPPGQRYEPRALRCDRVCLYYRHFLRQNGECLRDSQYAPACVNISSGVACPGNQYLRDKNTCVAIQDCNCRLPNGMAAPPGRPFLVADCEMCQCVNNLLRCDSSSCITTTPTTADITGKPTFECNKWSSWLSESSPSEGSERELLSELRAKYPKLCSRPRRVECRVRGSHESPEEAQQVVTCHRKKGLECDASQNPGGCKDYEVRFLCECGEFTDSFAGEFTESTTLTSTTYHDVSITNVTTVAPLLNDICPESMTHEECAMPCDRICMYYHFVLTQNSQCKSDGDCAPGCVDRTKTQTCPSGFFMFNESKCVSVADCNCRLPDGRALPAGVTYNISPCEQCTCQNNNLLCSRLKDCEEPSTEPTVATHTIPTVQYTPRPPTTIDPYDQIESRIRCNDWSPYYKKDEKDPDGLMLSLDMLRTRKEFVCDNPVNASCREVNTKLPATDLGQTLTCDAVEGLKCLNLDNAKDCHNYEISFFCVCDETTPISTAEITLGTTTTLAPCDAWSPWINDIRPWQSDGDAEFKTLHQLREEHQFCLEGQLADIECVETATGLNSAADKDISCDVRYGFRCLNADQNRGSCLDYKIRYYCSCETTTTVTTIIPDFFTPPPVCDPDKYISLLDEVPDSAFSSTRARNSVYGPSSARLYHSDGSLTTRSWAPLVSDKNQYIQVDLGSVVPVYGVEVAGNPLTRERVTAFTVQVSRDNNIWSALPSDPKNPTSQPKVFKGPSSPAEPVRQMFDEPVDARYIRLKPVDWYRAIALRAEVIGCELPTLPTLVTTTKPECEEPMGLEDGQMSDKQVEVSSVLNNQDYFYGKQNIRLNTLSTPYTSAGAWVAEPKPDQFVRFDFMEPSKLSGLITQGRSSSDEWVQSFSVRYSPDGETWNTIQDPDGSDKVFPGNFDRNTPVKTKFDRIILARYLEIRPKTWRSSIAMRAEVLGCFHPYPEVTTTPAPRVTTTEPPPPYCSPCPGLPAEYYDRCAPCSYGKYFDGQTCVAKVMCPCYKDGHRYEFGSIFESSECEECECVVGGDVQCIDKECPPCEDEHQAVITPFCSCVCKPCPEGTRLCSSSNYCLNESSWCNGIEECPDDELNCPTPTPEIPEVCPTPYCPDHWVKKVRSTQGLCPAVTCEPPTTVPTLHCPIPLCPPRYDIVFAPTKLGDMCPTYECVPPITTMEPPTCPPPNCPEGYVVQEPDYFYQFSQQTSEDVCTQYQCVTAAPPTAPCPPPSCPQGYDIYFADSKALLELCPPYECVPIITTTMCPPVECPSDLRIMYIQGSESSTCPQYTCVQVTTPFPVTTPQPTVSKCPPMELPICGIDEEFYQINPEDACPQFACKPIGSPPPATTTALPRTISPECKMEGRTFTSFDDSSYELEPCNHILAEDKISKDWIVSVHKNCSESTKCDRYLNITQENKQLILRPDLLIVWDENTYTVTQAQRIGTSTNTFSVSRVGDSIYFESKTHNFSVEWNVEMNVNVRLGDHLVDKVDGLCGFYTGEPKDDKTKPDGTLATTLKEYGQSWALDDEVCDDKPKCTPEITSKAFELCSTIQSKPFTECHSSVDPAPFLKSCVDTMCDCLSGDTKEEECRCQALTRYVTRCLEKNPDAPISDWRIVAKCYKECGPGEVYQDCFRAKCEKSCENMHDDTQCPEEKGSCIPGCFCTPGLVRKGDRCIVPEQCRDCVCEGYGDPHYVTFDRFNYTFNGECSFVAARDKNARGQHKFEVITRNKQCTPEPVTVCTDAVTILFGSHTVFISAVGEDSVSVTVDEEEVTSFPHREPWLALEQPDPSQVMAAIPEIQLEVVFFLENFGFSIRLPSRLYFNNTEGLCGNCNHDDEDDLQVRNGGLTESVDKFGRSWLLENEPRTCGVLEKDATLCIPLPPDQDPCLKIMNDDLFGKCHPVEDPASYVSSCQLDACGSREPEVAACHSLEAYARRCADLDICLDWRSEELCPKNCTGGQEYRACAPGCVHTCDNHEQLDASPESCPISSVDGCFCPDGMVLDNGTCVNASYCKTCDDEGHRMGEVWKTDPCTTCECTDRGSICSTKTCPEDPICDEGYIVVEVSGTGDDCCGPRKKCKVKPTEHCPPPVEPTDGCGFGHRQKLIEAPGVCPQYACVCLEPDDCPALVPPDDEDLKPGEEWTLDESGCCARFITKCSGTCPKFTCPEFHVLKEEQLKDDECCPKTKCDPPADACIYEHKYLVNASGYERPVNEFDTNQKKLYKVNESWEDGLCLTCRCSVDSEELPHYQCTQQTCPPLKDHPDRGEYELESVETPGQCCPTVVRTACIDDYEAIQIGETLDDPLNGCRSVECVKTQGGKVEKIEKSFTCDESCPAGWKYEPSPLYPQQCCGECVQVACVLEGQVKGVGETWVSDDLCTTFTCSRDTHDQIQVQAVEVQCTKPSEKELEHYVFEETTSPDQCCSVFTRVACLLNGSPIPAGQSIQDPDDSCSTVTCDTGADGNVTRRERETTCDADCELGSTYLEPLPFSNDCCGKCIKTHCVDDGKSYSIGERWESEGDLCYEYSCETRNDVLTTVAAKKECPYFDPECPEEEIYMDELGCCKLCNITRQEKRDCKPKAMPLQETVGIFQISTRHVGVCKNPAPVPDFKQCSGHCDSYTTFQGHGRQAIHVSTCFCCKPSRYDNIRVPLRCDSGVTFSPVYKNIAECECLKCNDGMPEYMGDAPILDDIDFFAMTDEPTRE